MGSAEKKTLCGNTVVVTIARRNIMIRTVLCVSDDPSALQLYRSMLELEGDSVLLARDVEDGIRLAKTEMVDCIVVDHQTHGAFVAKKIAQLRQSPPIIFVFDGLEMPVESYPDVAIIIGRDAIGNLARCIKEVLNRRRCESTETDEVEPELDTFASFVPLHRLSTKWLLAW
jgi:CheY-like chemotaxis protein